MAWNNKTLVLIARLVLGVILVVFGLNGFFGFMSMPPPPAALGALMGAIAGSGLIYVVKAFEVIIGLMFLFNKYTPLATVMLTPLSISFLYIHLALAPAGGAIAYLVAILNVYFILVYKKNFASLMKA